MMNQLPVKRCQYCGGKDIRVGWQQDALVTFKRNGLLGNRIKQPIKIDCSSDQAFSANCCAIFSLATATINLIRFSWLTSLAPASQSIIAMLAFG